MKIKNLFNLLFPKVMFRGKERFTYLNSSEVPAKERAVRDGNKDFIVRYDGGERFYLRFGSPLAFYLWYKDIPDGEKNFHEVIFEGPQKFRLDIDERVTDDRLREICTRIKIVFRGIGCKDPLLAIYDIRTSYHIVVSNYYFLRSSQCLEMAGRISNTCDDVDIDMGVYKRVQNFRLEGSTKHGQCRPKLRIGGSGDVDEFLEGVIGYVKGTHLASCVIPVPREVDARIEQEVGYSDDFEVRHRRGKMTVLDRTRSSYCRTCRRVHDSENAYIIGEKLYCFRALEK
jgi:hypothetical protein